MEAQTIGAILAGAKARFAAVSSSPGLDAQLLIAAALGLGRANVLAHPEIVPDADQAATLHAWIERRATGEPIAYILGRRAFYDRDFIVTPDVLIPRPETEHLLEAALADVDARQGTVTAVDVGTGSGALAVTLKALRPQVHVTALDISPAALDVARQNTALYGVDVRLIQGDLLAPLVTAGEHVDLIMANLPYIATEPLAALAVARHEPHLALDGGLDGLDLIRRLLAQVPAVTGSGACILLEIGADQGAAVIALARAALPDAVVKLAQDYAGHDRLVSVRR